MPKGVPLSEETKKKMRDKRKNQPQNQPCSLDCTCSRHSLTPSYSTKHQRIARYRGKARDELCVRCLEDSIDKQAQHWAMIHTEDGTDPWADYVPMCIKCHHIYDKIQERVHPKGRIVNDETKQKQSRSRKAWIAKMTPEERIAAFPGSSPCQLGCTCKKHRKQLDSD